MRAAHVFYATPHTSKLSYPDEGVPLRGFPDRVVIEPGGYLGIRFPKQGVVSSENPKPGFQVPQPLVQFAPIHSRQHHLHLQFANMVTLSKLLLAGVLVSLAKSTQRFYSPIYALDPHRNVFLNQYTPLGYQLPMQQPVMQQLVTPQSVMQQPTGQQPVMQQPIGQQPVMQQTLEQPISQHGVQQLIQSVLDQVQSATVAPVTKLERKKQLTPTREFRATLADLYRAGREWNRYVTLCDSMDESTLQLGIAPRMGLHSVDVNRLTEDMLWTPSHQTLIFLSVACHVFHLQLRIYHTQIRNILHLMGQSEDLVKTGNLEQALRGFFAYK
eukprot:Blabericola_migrator_1__1767@NODE_1478_length_4459_cov_94_961749_g746_i1_p2_GENE_NODE_1478_length_4459_cov_94_961749_g746_i1NODE_1478_length_4459_cov_94_961749_g746_i1_p2_ORF_typecomplete_len328_score34_79SSDP/PF04503_13/0_059_NODE_1478_length_4459_cov_94_961749_g746_i14401423